MSRVLIVVLACLAASSARGFEEAAVADRNLAAALALSRIDTAEARDAFSRHVGKEARRAIDRPKAKQVK